MIVSFACFQFSTQYIQIFVLYNQNVLSQEVFLNFTSIYINQNILQFKICLNLNLYNSSASNSKRILNSSYPIFYKSKILRYQCSISNIIYNKPHRTQMSIRNYINRYNQQSVSFKVHSNINKKDGLPQTYRKEYFDSPKSDTRRQKYKSIELGSPISNSAFSIRKKSLPPIMEQRKRQIFDLDIKKSEVMDKFFTSKSRCQKTATNSQRHRTQGNSLKLQYKLSSRSSNVINLSQIRMKPVDKYFHKLSNIRLAQRLLVVKPSPQLSRINQRKFYLQQKHYRCQISRNYNLKAKKNKNASKAGSPWVE